MKTIDPVTTDQYQNVAGKEIKFYFNRPKLIMPTSAD